MMVTFISQCEKKALNKTRRVLDAFANRIGDNTWQTVITNEGLLAVKKLLRKTATKNTAVSCFWIRSRARSELVWIVGSKQKFNKEGIVPVNRTGKEVFMDIKQEKPVKGVIYANTHLQTLEHHLFAVGFIAQQLYLYFYPEKTNQANAAFIAGCFHDIGKLDPAFQKWVVDPKNQNYEGDDGQHINTGKFSFENHPRHNEISVLIYHLLDERVLKSISTDNKQAIKHCIYWHHAKPFRAKEKEAFDTYGKIYDKLKNKTDAEAVVSLLSDQSISMLNTVASLDQGYRDQAVSSLTESYVTDFDTEKIISYEQTPLPSYKEYGTYEDLEQYQSKTRVNSANNEIRACLITADRWVSSLSASDLAHYIKAKKLDRYVSQKIESKLNDESDLVSHINECLDSFPDSERTQQQSTVAKKLADDSDHVKVLAGAAGCGKTKIALEWASLTNAQQIIWVCPRVQICQGMFTELKASNNPYLQRASVEIFTGEFKFTDSFESPTPEQQQLTADIVITTIDQLLNSVVSHTKADRLLNYLSAHVVFDEYHEYITMPAFNLLFAELVKSREELNNGANALLVSATPNYFYLKNMLGLDLDYDVVEMTSFNKRQYQFDFTVYDETSEDEKNPLYKQHNDTTFVISNTAITAQKSFITNLKEENAILLHSKFKKSDKKKLFNRVFESFKRDGNQLFDVLRSGPIVQASLNISCDHMVSEITTAENCLQRMGRLDRFGVNEAINHYIIAVPESLHEKKGKGALARFLSSSNTLASTKAWYEFLSDRTDNGEKIVSISEVYAIYKEFYHIDSPVNKFLEQDMLAGMKKSAGVITSRVSEPKTISIRSKDKSQRVKIANGSLRGNNRFVQMAQCNLDDKHHPEFIDAYAYTFPITDDEEIDNLTMACELIEGYGDSSNNLLSHMVKKHHNIMGGVKAYKDFVLLNDAKDPEFPIYLSYTSNDLDEVGGEPARHNAAIYYGVCQKQAIGAISIKNLTQQ